MGRKITTIFLHEELNVGGDLETLKQKSHLKAASLMNQLEQIMENRRNQPQDMLWPGSPDAGRPPPPPTNTTMEV